MALEQERFQSCNREALIHRRIDVLGEISALEAQLLPLKHEEVVLRTQIIESMTSSKYEPPKIPKYPPLNEHPKGKEKLYQRILDRVSGSIKR